MVTPNRPQTSYDLKMRTLSGGGGEQTGRSLEQTGTPPGKLTSISNFKRRGKERKEPLYNYCGATGTGGHCAAFVWTSLHKLSLAQSQLNPTKIPCRVILVRSSRVLYITINNPSSSHTQKNFIKSEYLSSSGGQRITRRVLEDRSRRLRRHYRCYKRPRHARSCNPSRALSSQHLSYSKRQNYASRPRQPKGKERTITKKAQLIDILKGKTN